MIMRPLSVFLLTAALLSLTACGIKGSLYLPEIPTYEAPQDAAEQAADDSKPAVDTPR